MSATPSLRAALAALLCLAIAAGAPAAAGAKPRTGPAGDAFYTPPAKLPGKRHGDLVWWRKLTGAAAAPGAARTDLVLYRSTGVDGSAVAVSGVVSVPKGHAPKGGWPVVTWAHGTTGIADQCAPSRDTATGPVHPYNNYVFPLLQRWLKAGWAVVRTDYEGLGTPGVHPYLIGNSEGRSTLDVVRAARELEPSIGKQLLISGHSQGGHAALFAAALEPRYTPELKLRGTVAFAPASQLDDQIPLTTGITTPSALSGLIALITRGISVANPTLDVTGQLSDQAVALYPQTLTECLPQLAAPSAFGALSPAAMFKPNPDFTAVAKALDQQDPTHLTIRTPLRIEQGLADTTVIPLFTDKLQMALKANGSKLVYKTYTGLTHGGVVTSVAPQKDATAWMTSRLR